jgi:GAF domain-containing protein
MKRRSKAGKKPTTGRRRKTPAKRLSVSKDARAPNVPSGKNDREFRRLTRELSEAREQQAAVSEVLKAISGSTFDLPTVLDTLLRLAVKLCGADQGTVAQRDGDTFYRSVSYGFSPAYLEYVKDIPVQPGRDTGTGRALLEGKVIHIPDVLADPDFTWTEGQRLGGFRTVLGVPMLREGAAVGVLALTRSAVRPFSEEQIALVENFAAQAVIAIEDARLLNELRQRTSDLIETLDQQTATSDVLQVISSSPGDLAPVFATMLENATRVCDADFGVLALYEGEDRFRVVAMHNAPPAYAELRQREPVISPGPFVRMVMTKQPFQISDMAEQPAYKERGDPDLVSFIELTGVRTNLLVPMLKDDELIGIITAYRTEVRPFANKQMDLLKNFAAQAVIAIENARLLNELRERTTDLTEALEQQSATLDVLRIISSSPSDLEAVFNKMLENATRICDAKFGTIDLRVAGGLRLVAAFGVPPTFAAARGEGPFHPAPGGILDTVVKTGRTVHIPDLAATQSYIERHPRMVEAVETAGIRTAVGVPMLRDDELIGIIAIFRQEVSPFTDKQIELLSNFAAQAVIAIENARLLNELRQRTDDLSQRTTDLTEALEQQTATSEVLQVISSSPGDLGPVFAAMLGSATRICEAKFGNFLLREGETFRLVAGQGELGYRESWRREPLIIKTDVPDLPLARLAETKQRVHVADLRQEAAYKAGFAPLVALVDQGGARTLLIVPMIKERFLVGAIALYRQEVRPFTDKQIELVENFAAQAVIAIENARLLKELRERTDQVEKLNQHLEQRVSDQVGEIERMGRLRRFLPPQVADLIVATGTEKQLESHRREITALFCDLRGFTGFTESADAEDVIALLREYHAAVGEKIIKYSGTLERYAGDGVMVVFNDPVPVENPALQAVLMALEMREAIGALTETWRRWGHDIGFGIGIAHGFATLGTIGFEGRFDYAAIGTVSNVASRLCDEAKPGQILISPRVLTKVEDVVNVEPVGEFELKGIRRPLAAYNVIGAVS